MPINAVSKAMNIPDWIAETHDTQFVVHTRLIGTDLEPLHRHLEQHLHYLKALHSRKIFAFGGPFFTAEGKNTGNGFYVLKVDSLDEAHRLAGGDPLHAAGVRAFTVEPWLRAFA